MNASTAGSLLDGWRPAESRPVHQRLGALLVALHPGVPIGADTLGERNQRLLRLHRELVGRSLQARVTCGACQVVSEFEVPGDAILAFPAPDRGARVRLSVDGRRAVFRLPRMEDLSAVAHLSAPRAIRSALLERCRVGAAAELLELSELTALRLAARFDALDPAASVEVAIKCSGCGRALKAAVDPATFVAADIDRLVEDLLADIDAIAGAYGWAESEILELPQDRRARYVGLIRRELRPATTRAATR